MPPDSSSSSSSASDDDRHDGHSPSPPPSESSSSHSRLQPPPVDPNIQDGDSPPPSVIPFLTAAFRKSAFLRGLRGEELHVKDEDLEELVRHARAVHFPPGSTVMAQGCKHQHGHHIPAQPSQTPMPDEPLPIQPAAYEDETPLYILQSEGAGMYVRQKKRRSDRASHGHGHVHASHEEDHHPVRVGLLHAGSLVGDMSLLSGSAPSISVRSEGNDPLIAWRLSKNEFDAWLQHQPGLARSLAQRRWLWQAISSNYLFRQLDDEASKEKLLANFQKSVARAGEPIVEFGETGDRFYVVGKGRCSIEVPKATALLSSSAFPNHDEDDDKSKATDGSVGKKSKSPVSAAETNGFEEGEEEDIPASSKTGHAGKLIPRRIKKKIQLDEATLDARKKGQPWSGYNPDLPDLDLVKVAEKHPSESFGELALLYSVPRCATVRCIAPDGCELWSVDGSSFLKAASKGSLFLKHIFYAYASVRDPSTGAAFMNRSDFFEAVKATKWRNRDELGNKIREGDQGALKEAVKKEAASDSPHLNESTLRLMFHLADQSGDELISFSEFVLLYGLLQSPMAKYQMAFRMFDKDKNGFIDRDEFIQVVRSLSSDSTHKLTNLANDPFIVELFGPEDDGGSSAGGGVKSKQKQLTYAEFESLLSRDVLPAFLQSVNQDLHKINQYWQELDLALTASSAGEAGLMSGSALSAVNAPSGKTSAAISWKSLVAGGIAGAVSRTIVSPFERLKLLFQMQGHPPRYTGIWQGLKLIHAEDGMKGYFRGNFSNVIRITPASAFQFFFYDVFKKLLFGDRKDLNPFERLGAGGLAGMSACFLTYPLDFIRARLTLQGGKDVAYRGIIHGMTSVLKENGVRGLYRGLWPSLVGVFPYIGIDFAVYETLRTHLPPSCKNERGETSRTALFVCGAVAGVVGQTVAYPLDLVRRRLQVQGFSSAKYHYTGGILSTMRQIIKVEGIQGLYKGMIPNYAKVVPAVSVSFVVYEHVRKVLDNR